MFNGNDSGEDDDSTTPSDTADDDIEDLVERLRNSQELKELREAARGPKFDPQGAPEALEHTDTERGDPTIITLHYKETFEEGRGDFVPWSQVTVKGYFSEEELIEVRYEWGEMGDFLAGAGATLRHKDGEISTMGRWIS